MAYRQVNESGSSNSIQEYNKGVEENILVNDPTASRNNSRRDSVASNRGKCTEQSIHSLTGVDQPSQSSPSVPRIEHHRESTCSAEGIQQSSEHLHADFPTQTVEKEQTIIKGRQKSKRRSGGGFFGSRKVHEGSRPDNSTGHRHRRDQAKQTEVLLASGTDSENSANPGVVKSNPSIGTPLDIKMTTPLTPKFAAASDLSAFQKDQYLRSGLQSLNYFTGGSLQRFDTWLDTFEAIILDAGMTEKDVILELYKKMSEKAQRIMKYILNSGDDSYKSIRERLLDHFHGDETKEKSLKKLKKAVRKPGEKVYDFAIRLKEIFQRTYPKNYEEDSFQIILQERFIDGLDEKLQKKVKYKEFETFDDLVSATRKYSVRMEEIESHREKREFVNAIKHVDNPNESEIKEIKQIVNAIATMLKQGTLHTEEMVIEQNELSNCVRELSSAVSFLLLKDKEQLYEKNATNYQNQASNFQPMQQNIGNNTRLPFKPFINYTKEPNPPFYSKHFWQTQPTHWQQHLQVIAQQPSQKNLIDFSPPTQLQQYYKAQRKCYFCGELGHTQKTCYIKRQTEFAESPICCSCKQMGHKSSQCPNNSTITC